MRFDAADREKLACSIAKLPTYPDSEAESGKKNIDVQSTCKIMSELPFEPGHTYDRVEDIHEPYGGNRYSGISPSSEYPYVFIFFGKSGEWHGYEDELLEDGTFLYTGEGREGDMTMEAGNAAIRDHKETGDELHVFEIEEGAWEVTYVGEFEYQTHRWTRLPDRNDNRRDAVRFELVPAGGIDMDIEAEEIGELSTEDLYEKAERSVAGEDQPTTQSSTRTTYPRSEVVKQYALDVADGYCIGCENEAPFLDENGDPFLEVHHLHRRSDGGPDHPNNVVAICPNCHRRVHQGKDGEEFNRELIQKSNSR